MGLESNKELKKKCTDEVFNFDMNRLDHSCYTTLSIYDKNTSEVIRRIIMIYRIIQRVAGIFI